MEATQVQFLLNHWLSSFMLVFARVISFASLGPVINHPNVPVLVRVAISILLTIMLSLVVPSAPTDLSQYNYFLSIAMNIAVGLLIGFLARLVLDIVEVSGEVMDDQLGLNQATLMNPSTGQPSPLLSTFFRTFGLVVFMTCGGIEMTLMTFVKSFKLFPLSSVQFEALNINMLQVVKMTGDVVSIGVVGAAPVLVILIFTEIVLGLMSRMAQQINPFSLSLTLKPVVGILVIMFTLPFFQRRLVQVFMEGVQFLK